MRFRIVPALLALIWLAPNARAWDATGHMQIADIAWTQLRPR